MYADNIYIRCINRYTINKQALLSASLNPGNNVSHANYVDGYRDLFRNIVGECAAVSLAPGLSGPTAFKALSSVSVDKCCLR